MAGTGAAGPRGGQRCALVVVGHPCGLDSVRDLRQRVQAMLESDDVDVVTCDLSDLGRCDAYDLAAIDELARLQLTAHRLGKRILIRADSELAGLFDLTGLNEFLPCDPD